MDVRPTLLIHLKNPIKAVIQLSGCRFYFIMWRKDYARHRAMTERQPAQDRETKSRKYTGETSCRIIKWREIRTLYLWQQIRIKIMHGQSKRHLKP